MTSMDDPQRQLFGRFPRAVGSPEQHIVHSEGEFDIFTSTVLGRRNAYSSLSWFQLDGTVICDKVSFDLDAPKDEYFDVERDDKRIEMMRWDLDLADKVLGKVCEDARKLADALLDWGFPVMGVFSGFGIHIHALTQPEENPAENMGSTARYWRDQLGLPTLDHKPIGDEQRIMRVPNMKRVHLDDVLDRDATRYDCDLWTVPLTGEELAEITPEWLLELSEVPRPDVTVGATERPDMPLYDDYTRDQRAVTMRPDRPSVEGEIADDDVDWYIKELLQLPCMYENILLDPEPPHEVRLNSAVLMFNIGMTPDEVLEVFAAIGWSDWDRSVTRQQLEHAYRKGYSDMSCETLRKEGFCTRQEEPENCETFGWSGGEVEWE